MNLQRHFAVIALEAQHVDFSYTEDVKEVAESIKKRIDMIFKEIELRILEEKEEQRI